MSNTKIMTPSLRLAGFMLLSATAVILVTGAAYAAGTFTECAFEKLKEILEIATITTLVSIILEKGLEELGKLLVEEAGKKILEKLIKALAKKLVPWIGVALIILDLVLLLKDCFPLIKI
jgi:hypothetical protein